MLANRLFVAIVLLCIMSSCKQAFTPKEYVKWFEKESDLFSKTVIISNYKYTCKFIPWQYKLAKEIEQGVTMQQHADKRRKELDGMYYVDINIDLLNKTSGGVMENDVISPEDFNARLYYISYRMQDDIFLVSGNDRRPCSLYLFERNFGLKSSVDISTAFIKIEKDENITVELNSQVFRTGIINFEYDKNVFNSIPEVKFN